jgi:protein-S-isoprenylcysteine O-methyltransferase Ste14
VQILGYGVLALILALTVASAVAATKVKDVKKARAASGGFRQARMWVAVLCIFGATVAPFKHGLTDKGVPGLLAWPMTVLCPLFLALFLWGWVMPRRSWDSALRRLRSSLG